MRPQPSRAALAAQLAATTPVTAFAAVALATALTVVALAAAPRSLLSQEAARRTAELPQPSAQSSSAPVPLLEVPFVPQSPDLCGGAAVAMVVRYWGGQGVSSEDFAHLVTDQARGITTGDLRRAAEELGWHAFAFRGEVEDLRVQLERGRPLIALVQVAPNRFHYVVLVGWLGERVVLHDPARGPYLTPHVDELLEAWEPAERWAMLLLPDPAGASAARDGLDSDAPDRGAETAPRAADPSGSSPCAGLVARGVALAREGATAEAEAALESAQTACPGEAAPLREHAGLRLKQGRPDEAAKLSERALALEPDDLHAVRTLAAARYVAGDERAALAAWNRVDAPRIDLVQTEGTARVPPPTLVRVVALRPGELLTPGLFGRAERRLADIPAVQASRLAYHPLPAGSARLVAAIQEAPSLPTGAAELAVTALRTAAHRELVLHAASPLRSGELWTARSRFESGRPAAALELAVPAAWPAAGGVWRVGLGWERQAYRRPGLDAAGFGEPGLDVVTEERLRGEVELGRWETEWLRWRLGTALDRWDDPGRHVSISGGLAVRVLGDRLSLSAGGERWFSLESGSPFALARGDAEWRSRTERRGVVWSLSGGGRFVSSGAPLAVWPGAGEGRARDAYLRAHPLLRDGQVAGPAFGRALAHAGGEVAAWTGPGGRLPLPARFGLAAFLDLARWGKNPPREPEGFLHADAGLGVRLAPGSGGGTLRLDVARGLRDGEMAVTAGWEGAWPRLER